MKSLIQHRKTERFLLLYALYRKSNGTTQQSFNLREMAFSEGIGLRAFKACFDFLSQEQLIRPQMSGEQPFDFYRASISDAGLMVIEEVFRDEMQETPYFPSYREMMM